MTRTGFVCQEPLPYSENGLSPYISSKTLSVHYGKHHKLYVEKTNHLIKGTNLQRASLEEIIFKSAGQKNMKPLFNNAAQAWNHSFYWKSMKPRGGGTPGREILNLIKASFGSLRDFKKEFEAMAVGHFGSGWVWLVKKNGKLAIVETHDAVNPLVSHEKPLIALDVWEHAYYLDYQNQRVAYTKAFLNHLVDWNFAENNWNGEI